MGNVQTNRNHTRRQSVDAKHLLSSFDCEAADLSQKIQSFYQPKARSMGNLMLLKQTSLLMLKFLGLRINQWLCKKAHLYSQALMMDLVPVENKLGSQLNYRRRPRR